MFQRRKSAMYASELGLGIQESFRRMLDMNEGDDGLIDSSILNPSFGSFLPGKIGDLNSSSTTPVDGLSYAHTMGSSAFDFLQNAPETASLVSHARAVTDSIDMSSILCDPIQPENNHSHLLEGADSDDYSLMSACKGDASLDTLSFDLQSPFARVMSFSPEYNSTGFGATRFQWRLATEMPHIMSSAIPGISTTSPTLQATSLITTPTSIISPRESELLLSQNKTLFEATLAGHSQDPSTSGGRTESPFMFKVDDDTVCQAQFSALKPLRWSAVQ
ncbi:hypothetical protein BSLG_009699 [Batrachochytrium salamandrivorans]|nr:hypothetical protein BSLG_009699 [Batrachochytrium salamandrivorans]